MVFMFFVGRDGMCRNLGMGIDTKSLDFFSSVSSAGKESGDPKNANSTPLDVLCACVFEVCCPKKFRKTYRIGSMGLVYLPTFTIRFNQM